MQFNSNGIRVQQAKTTRQRVQPKTPKHCKKRASNKKWFPKKNAYRKTEETIQTVQSVVSGCIVEISLFSESQNFETLIAEGWKFVE